MTIGVGIIGASQNGWAALGHVPALAALPEFELRAVSTTRKDTAQAAARAFSVPAAFDNHRELIAHPGVDLVVVAVKVAHHHELVSAALASGKMVYSEWPLGVDAEEAASLASQARQAGVRTVIGLQGRFSPAVRRARDLIQEGYIGAVLGSTIVGSGVAWGAATASSHAYMFDAASGASPLTVPAMQALEAVNFVLGDFRSLSAHLVHGRREVKVTDTGGTLPVTVADQIALTGVVGDGTALSFFYRGGHSRGDNLRWEINGTEGDLVLSAPGINGNLQVADLHLEGGQGTDTALRELPIPTKYFGKVSPALTGPPHNVAQTYALLAQDLRNGTDVVPGFDHALSRHRLLEAIQESAQTGERQYWPA